MISYLSGKIIFKNEKFLILDVNGVGYKVLLSPRALHKIAQKRQNHNPHTKREQSAEGTKFGAASSRYGVGVNLFCYLRVKENALDLYGFLSQKELEFFETLINIRNIGPKAALEITSIAPMEELKEAIEKEDEKIMKEIFKIGRKKAQILILELSRKIKDPPKKETGIAEDEAFQALVNLGFSQKRIKEALSKVPKEIMEPQRKVKIALKFLGK